MTQAIALPTPASPRTAAPQTADATVAAGEGFAAALAQLLGIAAPSTSASIHAHAIKPQQSSQAKAASNASQPDASLIASPVPTAPTTQVLSAPAQTSNTSQRTAANVAIAAMQAVASAPSATPGTPTVEQSATANGETTPPRTPQFQTALQLAQLAAPAAAAASTLLQTNSTSAEKAAPKAAPSKHAPNAATTATATTDAAGTDTQPANRKLTIEAPLATAAQQPGTQGTVSDGAPTAGGKTDAAVAQLPASATQLVINLHTPGDAQSATAQAAPSSAPIPLDALAVHIARKFESGESRFEIRLDPIELGKLDISVTVGDDGRVQAVVRAERPETLDMLQRDARLLEGQLRQSGLNVDSNSLNFSLGSGNDHRQTLANGAHGFAQALDIVPEIEPIKTATAIVSLRDGVDIRI